MPLWGLLSNIIGTDGEGQQQSQIVRDPNRDSFAYQNQVQQQSQQVSNQQAMQQQQAASISDSVSMSAQAYRAYLDAFQGVQYHIPIEYDTSNETTLKMCDVIKKATERLWLK